MNDIRWNRIIIDDFLFNACLTDDEKTVLFDWANGKTPVSTAMNHNMSVSQVGKLRTQIRQKYDDVQPFTPLLPKRE